MRLLQLLLPGLLLALAAAAPCRTTSHEAETAARAATDPITASVEEKCKPSDKNFCEYSPGKVECCTPGEMCIPNVGCRS